MNMQELIHKLATDQPVTETEFLALLAAVIKAKEKEKNKTANKYLYYQTNYN